MRCLNFWDNKNFWGAKSGPPSPATSVKWNTLNVCNQPYLIIRSKWRLSLYFVYCCCLMNVELSSICHDQLLFVGALYSTAVILISQFYLHWSKLGQAEKIKRDFSQEKKKRLVLTCHFTRFFDIWFRKNQWYAVRFTKFYSFVISVHRRILYIYFL